MIDKIILAGFGGQGVMFIGKIFAVSGMVSDLEVCWIPSYGPEMRGGTANCSVILSDEEIHSPVIDKADGGIVLNQPSYDKFFDRIKPGGSLVVNTSLCELNKKEMILILSQSRQPMLPMIWVMRLLPIWFAWVHYYPISNLPIMLRLKKHFMRWSVLRNRSFWN